MNCVELAWLFPFSMPYQPNRVLMRLPNLLVLCMCHLKSVPSLLLCLLVSGIGQGFQHYRLCCQAFGLLPVHPGALLFEYLTLLPDFELGSSPKALLFSCFSRYLYSPQALYI